MSTAHHAVIVGSGPNGLAAAITLARAGLRVTVLEGSAHVGGGLRSGELTLPGFTHDECSAVHPLAAGSPYLRTLPLGRFGLTWVHPTTPLAHPLGNSAVILHRSLDATVDALGPDGAAYRALVGELVTRWDDLAPDLLRPLPRLPRDPLPFARFGLKAAVPASVLARTAFRTPEARALLAGLAAHTTLPLTRPGTAAAALMLAAAGHAHGWPFPRGGAQALADAMAAYLQHLGGTIVTNHPVRSARDLPPARLTLLDITPRALLHQYEHQLPAAYAAWLRAYRHGPGVIKLDYALSAPVPWTAPAARHAGTLHLGGTLRELEASERAPWQGEHPTHPYVLAAQHTPFDPTRAPAGQHTLWAYAHVPSGSNRDITPAVEAQIERYAPGFRNVILARNVWTAQDLAYRNPNQPGGDITGGVADLWGLLARPVPTATPYRTPVRGVYLCSASTPPGPGVHGMSGHHAARAALKDEYGMG